MKNFIYAAPLLIALPGLALADSVTLDFDFDNRSSYDARLAEDGLAHAASNLYWFSHAYNGSLIIGGAPGFVTSDVVSALDGFVFDALTVDVVTAAADIDVMECDKIPTGTNPYTGEEQPCSVAGDLFFTVTDTIESPAPLSIRATSQDGSVFSQTIIPDEDQIDLSALDGMTNLTAIRFSLGVPNAGDGFPVFNAATNSWATCSGTAGCGLIRLANLTLDVRGAAAVAPIPLPLPAALLLGGLAVLGATARRK